jgi:urea transporter
MRNSRGEVADSVADSVWAAVATAVGSEAATLLERHGDDVAAIRAALMTAADARLREALGGEPPEAIRAVVEPVLGAVATHLADGARMGADPDLVTAGVVFPLLVGKRGLLDAVRASSLPTR